MWRNRLKLGVRRAYDTAVTPASLPELVTELEALQRALAESEAARARDRAASLQREAESAALVRALEGHVSILESKLASERARQPGAPSADARLVEFERQLAAAAAAADRERARRIDGLERAERIEAQHAAIVEWLERDFGAATEAVQRERTARAAAERRLAQLEDEHARTERALDDRLFRTAADLANARAALSAAEQALAAARRETDRSERRRKGLQGRAIGLAARLAPAPGGGRPWRDRARRLRLVRQACRTSEPALPAARRTLAVWRLRVRPAALWTAGALVDHDLFDGPFYAASYPDVTSPALPPLVEFVVRGMRQERSPHPLFDMAWYLRRHPDARRRGGPIAHFLRSRAAEPLDPHPLFSTTYYAAQVPGLAAEGGAALHHYLRFGWIEGRTPHPLFDPEFYLDQHPDVAASGADPLRHFLTDGWRQRYDPHPLFDLGWYFERHPDVARSGQNPLLHFVEWGAHERRSPHPLFDAEFYRAQNGLGPDENPLVHYLVVGAARGCNPNVWFDSAAYLAGNPDVAAAGFNPLVHYVRFGRDEGRWER